nr:actin cytoskeleton-regulatory complex protein PAN1-like [Aegilops tauschii subsp. strangulata]
MARSGAWDGSEVHEDHIDFLRQTRRLPGKDYMKVRLASEREISPAPEEVLPVRPDQSAFEQSPLLQPAAGAAGTERQFLPDRAESDVDDPDLGAAALEDDAEGGGGGAGGSGLEAGLEDWPDDDAGEVAPRHQPGSYRSGASSSAAPDAQGGAKKHRAAPSMFGSRPKKPRGSAAATKRDEAAAKALRFRKPVKEPQLVSAAPLTLEKSAAASIVRSAETSTTTRRIDPATDLREATERNTREAREEQGAARLENAKAEKAEAAALNKLAEAEAADAAKKQAEEAARRQSAIPVTPLSSVPPPPEFVAQTGEAGGEHPIMERDSGDVAIPDVIVPRPPPSEGARDKQPADPPTPPAGNEMVMGPTPRVRTPLRRRLVKAASAPRPLETGAASSSIPDAEASSAAPVEWVQGGGTGPLNRALLDVQAKLRAEANALKRCNTAFLDSREAIQDYHNLRVAAFNSNVQELGQRTADLLESRKANAILQQQLGEANTVLRAKEADRNKLAGERDRLLTQLAERAELLKKDQKEAEDKETSLLAEFATERSAWTDKEAMLTAAFGEIEDIVDDFFPGHSDPANQAIEVDREGRRAEETQEDLMLVEDDLVKRAAAITEYTNTSVFIPERAETGAEAPPECLDELVNFAQFHPRGVFLTYVECRPRAFAM